jgi:hypothetical protein
MGAVEGDTGPRPRVREVGAAPGGTASVPVRASVSVGCDDCGARAAFTRCGGTDFVTPAFNDEIDLGGPNFVPAGKRAVIELVTATISVPDGEWARLRMFTSLGQAAGNFDLALVHQGVLNGKAQLVATHTLRAYTDGLLSFNINRDNPETAGEAFVCVSGYLADA